MAPVTRQSSVPYKKVQIVFYPTLQEHKRMVTVLAYWKKTITSLANEAVIERIDWYYWLLQQELGKIQPQDNTRQSPHQDDNTKTIK